MIRDHEDLVCLDDEQRSTLCEEIRTFLISNVAKTGGHLASNLGVVELTVAIETVFNTYKDRLVFDVGHQSYVHKLLTGRQADFARLRQYQGMAGFPKPSESDADAFVAGHASSSVSIALGMARARTLAGEDYHVVSLIGDGAATGGMAYEGLNDAAVSNEPMVVILNDNEMSIDRNVGGMASHLSVLRTKERYLGMKRRYRKFTSHIPGGKALYRGTRRLKEWLKRVLIPTTIFENMGFNYIGPVDGHDLPNLINILRSARDMRRPALVHVITQKGHGYKFAEESPSKFHGIGKFDPDTGETGASSTISFSAAFGQTMCELAKENEKLCAITAAMPGGTGLLRFKELYPDRLFDVGIAEEHAVSMAGGLAKQGYVPVVALYSTFLQRSYDMLLQDVAMLGLHVVFAVDRAGLVGEDGETHHGIFDVGFLRQVPGMKILCPASTAEMQSMLRWAVNECTGPVAVRYPRGGDLSFAPNDWGGDTGTIAQHSSGADATIVTYGTLVREAMEASQLLEAQGIHVSVLRILSPTDVSLSRLEQLAATGRPVLIVEETAANTGIGALLAYRLQHRNPHIDVYLRDLGAGFISHGDVRSLYKHCRVDAEGICQFVDEVLKNEG